MGFLTGGNKGGVFRGSNDPGQFVAEPGAPSYAGGVRLKTSAWNQPIPIMWGTRRLSYNVIWGPGPSGGGIGSHAAILPGHALDGFTGPNSAFVPAILALCEGPVDKFTDQWQGADFQWSKQPIGFGLDPPVQTGRCFQSALTGGFALGDASQPPYTPVQSGTSVGSQPGYVTGFPAEALGYVYVSYIATMYLFVGDVDASTVTTNSNLSLPQISWEAQRVLSFPHLTIAGQPGPDLFLSEILTDFLTSTQYGMGLFADDIDGITHTQYQKYQWAQGVLVSPLLTDGTTTGVDVVNRWATLSNSWIYWGGTQIVFCPLGDQTVTGNGNTFTPDLAAAYDLTLDDFLDAQAPVTVQRVDPADAYNRIRLEFSDRTQGYASHPVEYRNDTLVAQYGLRDAATVDGHDVCQLSVAVMLVELLGKRIANIRNTYKFKVSSARYIALLPGSIVTLTDPNLGLVKAPVRIREIEEDEGMTLSILAEELPSGVGTSTPQGSGQPGSGGGTGVGGAGAVPPNVNTPCIVEPNAAIPGAPLLAIAASGGNNWGGCFVWASTDNVTYSQIGQITRRAPQGTLTSTLPSHADPDTVDTLAVDDTESLTLPPSSVTHLDADGYRTLIAVAPQPTLSGGVFLVPTNFELGSYGALAATGPYTANLTYLHRAIYGSTLGAHVSGDQFTRLDYTFLDGSTIKYSIPSPNVGQPLYFKFQSYNSFGGNVQAIAGLTPYKYVPTGVGTGSGSGGVPSTTAGLTCSAGINQNFVSWLRNPSADTVQYYTVWRATGLGQVFGSAAPVWSGDTTEWTDEGQPAAAPSTYFVTATNANGTSAASSGVSVTTLAGVGWIDATHPGVLAGHSSSLAAFGVWTGAAASSPSTRFPSLYRDDVNGFTALVSGATANVAAVSLEDSGEALMLANIGSPSRLESIGGTGFANTVMVGADQNNNRAYLSVNNGGVPIMMVAAAYSANGPYSILNSKHDPSFITGTQVTSGWGMTYIEDAGLAPSSSPAGGTFFWSDPTDHALHVWQSNGIHFPITPGTGGVGTAGQILFTNATPTAQWLLPSLDVASSVSSIGQLKVVGVQGHAVSDPGSGPANTGLFWNGSALSWSTLPLAPGTAGQLLFTNASPLPQWILPSLDVSSVVASPGQLKVVGLQGHSLSDPASGPANTTPVWNGSTLGWSSVGVSWADDLSTSTNSAQWVSAISGASGAGGSVPMNSHAYFTTVAGDPFWKVGGNPVLETLGSDVYLNSSAGVPGWVIKSTAVISNVTVYVGSAGMTAGGTNFAIASDAATYTRFNAIADMFLSVDGADLVALNGNAMSILGDALTVFPFIGASNTQRSNILWQPCRARSTGSGAATLHTVVVSAHHGVNLLVGWSARVVTTDATFPTADATYNGWTFISASYDGTSGTLRSVHDVVIDTGVPFLNPLMSGATITISGSAPSTSAVLDWQALVIQLSN